MGARRLENAAQAAGFAMVNPDDFAGDVTPVLQAKTATPQAKPKAAPDTAVKSWFNWDYLRISGGKATA